MGASITQRYRYDGLLFKNATITVVFQAILDKYLDMRWDGRDEKLKLTAQNLERVCGVERHSITGVLKKLNYLGLVTWFSDGYRFNFEYYIAIMILFESSDRETQKEIRRAFLEADFDELLRLGLDENVDVDEELARFFGESPEW